MYRIKYYGDSKALSGKISAFEGTSGVFTIAGSASTKVGRYGRVVQERDQKNLNGQGVPVLRGVHGMA